MGRSQDPVSGTGQPSTGQHSTGQHSTGQHGSGSRTLTALGYVALLLLGALQGVIGSFQYGQPPTPVIAIILVVAIFVTCAASGWGMGTLTAGLLPAVGWIVSAFVLASPRPNGSVIITATTAGEWYLYGGAIGAAAGAVISFFVRLRAPARPR